MTIRNLLACGIVAISMAGGAASASSVTVNATDDIFLAGQSSVPTGFPANAAASGLGAGTLPVAINVTPGEKFTLIAAGTVSCCFGGSPTNGPDGANDVGTGTTDISGYGNVAAYSSAVQLALVGVYNGPGLPATESWTVFQIGSSAPLTVPTGVTTLYLGFADALGFNDVPGYYNDNTGFVTVSGVVPTASGVVPEASTWAMMVLGFVGLGFLAFLRARKTSAVPA